jgi:predicted Fe-Mo cluster-binding NifX family protein
MGIKVAIATSDGLNIDLHFGQTKSFLLYEFKDGKFELSEKREVQVDDSAVVALRHCGGSGGGCGGGAASGPLAPAVELLLDCRAVVAAQIGQGMRRQLERNAISVFDIEIPVEDALKKLAAYYAKFGE